MINTGPAHPSSPGENRRENYRKSRVPYLDVFPKDSSALDALCVLLKNGLLLKTSRPNFISHGQDRVSYSCRAGEMRNLSTPKLRAGGAGFFCLTIFQFCSPSQLLFCQGQFHLQKPVLPVVRAGNPHLGFLRHIWI